MYKHNLSILAIETSCDNTAVAILINGKFVFSQNINYIKEMQRAGGFIPSEISFFHARNLLAIFKELNVRYLQEIDIIAVTVGPGLMLSLTIGYNFAFMLSVLYNKPIFYVDHIEGHLLSNLYLSPEIQYPFLSVILTGAHALIVLVSDLGKYKLYGKGVDDAPGEVFDKIARELSLYENTGAAIEQTAKSGSLIQELSSSQVISKAKKNILSFSGFKTRFKEAFYTKKYSKADLCYTLQFCVFSHISHVIARILKMVDVTAICVSGGVACSRALKEFIVFKFQKKYLIDFVPPYLGCDNAEMIAWCARLYLLRSISARNSKLCYQKKIYDTVIIDD